MNIETKEKAVSAYPLSSGSHTYVTLSQHAVKASIKRDIPEGVSASSAKAQGAGEVNDKSLSEHSGNGSDSHGCYW